MVRARLPNFRSLSLFNECTLLVTLLLLRYRCTVRRPMYTHRARTVTDGRRLADERFMAGPLPSVLFIFWTFFVSRISSSEILSVSLFYLFD